MFATTTRYLHRSSISVVKKVSDGLEFFFSFFVSISFASTIFVDYKMMQLVVTFNHLHGAFGIPFSFYNTIFKIMKNRKLI